MVHLGVDRGRIDVTVPEHLGDFRHRRSAAKHLRRRRVTKAMSAPSIYTRSPQRAAGDLNDAW
jgi:hypothetical protein